MLTERLPPPIDHEIFRGYTLDDISRVEALHGAAIPDVQGLVDWFGVCIDASYAPWIAPRKGEVISRPPFPTDTFLAEGIEYAALGLALESAQNNSFCCIELGAGWGPWTALAVKCAEKMNIETIQIAAFEADAGRFVQLRMHLAKNGILPIDAPRTGRQMALSYRLEPAAIWWEDTTLYWPVGIEADSGRAIASTPDFGPDYRGFMMEVKPVKAVGLPNVLAEHARVDFLHIDIQGAEAEVVVRSIEAIEKTVQFMFIGTHSRKIEGDLIEFLYGRGWRLLREQPCVFDPMLKAPTLPGLTVCDGGQVWRVPETKPTLTS